MGILFLTTMIEQKLLPAKIIIHQRLLAVEHAVADELAVDVFETRRGYLSWRTICTIAVRNLTLSRSRTLITVGAISIGIGAIIFLVSFSYGLQSLVTNRLVRPNSLRIADMQSQSTALALQRSIVDDIKNLSGVEDVAPAIALAGIAGVSTSKMDTVVIATFNNYLEYSHVDIIAGRLFSTEADADYQETTSEITALQQAIAQKVGKKAEVAGVSAEAPRIERGQNKDLQPRIFRIKDMVYVPVRKEPVLGAEILGYVRGSVLEVLEGNMVWGSEFGGMGLAGRSVQGADGVWYGTWIKSRFPLYKEEAPTVYLPLKDESGSWRKVEGYIPQLDEVHVLTIEEKLIEEDLRSQTDDTSVLGESTASGSLEAPREASTSGNFVMIKADAEATQVAALEQIVRKDNAQPADNASRRTTAVGMVSVKRKAPKEAIVSTGMLQTLKKDPSDMLGKTLDMQFILSGGLIPGMDGRVLSSKETYTIVGVVKDANTALVYVPASDILSVGVDKYSTAKVLVRESAVLAAARSQIESLGFTTQSIVDTIVQVNKLFSIMRYLLASFGIIAFIVAIIGMFNTLTVTLLERTREVAVMKTLGTTNHDVSRLFMVESSLLGLVGGVGGIVVGLLLGLSVDNALSLLREDKTVRLFVFPPIFLVVMIGISMLVGVITGLYPARRSRSINALDALRYE